jgi:hypothetical protein
MDPPPAEKTEPTKSPGIIRPELRGAPAHWLEKVRRSAPHLLLPERQPQPGAPASTRPSPTVEAIKKASPLDTPTPAAPSQEPLKTQGETAAWGVPSATPSPPPAMRLNAPSPRLLPASDVRVARVHSTAGQPTQAVRRPNWLAASPLSQQSVESSQPKRPPRKPEAPRRTLVATESSAAVSERPLGFPPKSTIQSQTGLQGQKDLLSERPPVSRQSEVGQPFRQGRAAASFTHFPDNRARTAERSIASGETPGVSASLAWPLPPKGQDRWPALPSDSELDPLEEAASLRREAERQCYLEQELDGIYGPRRLSHRR